MQYSFPVPDVNRPRLGAAIGQDPAGVIVEPIGDAARHAIEAKILPAALDLAPQRSCAGLLINQPKRALCNPDIAGDARGKDRSHRRLSSPGSLEKRYTRRERCGNRHVSDRERSCPQSGARAAIKRFRQNPGGGRKQCQRGGAKGQSDPHGPGARQRHARQRRDCRQGGKNIGRQLVAPERKRACVRAKASSLRTQSAAASREAALELIRARNTTAAGCAPERRPRIGRNAAARKIRQETVGRCEDSRAYTTARRPQERQEERRGAKGSSIPASHSAPTSTTASRPQVPGRPALWREPTIQEAR